MLKASFWGDVWDEMLVSGLRGRCGKGCGVMFFVVFYCQFFLSYYAFLDRFLLVSKRCHGFMCADVGKVCRLLHLGSCSKESLLLFSGQLAAVRVSQWNSFCMHVVLMFEKNLTMIGFRKSEGFLWKGVSG